MNMKTNKVEVTIIIPVHNSERYLKECIQSAQMQTLEELEILCIDGGSTDSSPEIIRELQKTDKRIKYIKDANTSYGHKLNVGIKLAEGDYIAILESDDKIYRNMMAELYHVADAFDADIVDADYDAIFSYNGTEYRNTMHKYGTQEFYNKLIECVDGARKNIPLNGIWTGIYRKEFLTGQGIKLNESKGASFQDTSFLFLTGLLAEKVYHIYKPLYKYRMDNSGSSVKDNSKIYEIIGEMEFLRSELEKRDIGDLEVWKKYYTRKYNIFYWNYERLSSEGREMFLERYLEELKKDINAGNISREIYGADMYDRTFQLIDNKDDFVKMVLTQDVKKPWMTVFCEQLDKKIEDKNFVVFGAGRVGERVMTLLQCNNIRIQAVCDNSEQLQGTDKCGVRIVSVQEAIKEFKDAVYIIANKDNSEEMKEQLFKMGIEEKDIVVYQ